MDSQNLNSVPCGKKVPDGILKMRDNYYFFGILSLLYGLIFGICTYYNLHNVMTIVLTVSTQAFIIAALIFFKLKIGFKTIMCLLAWLLLAVSSSMTTNFSIIFFNTIGMSLLFATFLLIHFCDTKKWGLGKFMIEIIKLPFISLIHFVNPFIDFAKRRKRPENQKSKTIGYICIGISLSVLILLIVIPLLTSADAVFKNIFSFIKLPRYWIKCVIFGIFGWLASYGVFSYMVSDYVDSKIKDHKRFNAIVAVSCTIPITIVYLIFSIIQISFLFIGGFELPEGYTYAKYAREGFFQLLAVCIINIIILMICLKLFEDNKILKAILTLFSLCTGIMVASSAMRMLLYIESYELTMLRVMVLWSLVVISFLLIGCIITIYKQSFPLFNYGTIMISILYILFAISNPAVQITKFNLNYDGIEDINYLKEELASDSIPELDKKGIVEETFFSAKAEYEKYKDTKISNLYDYDYYYYESIWDTNEIPYMWKKTYDDYKKMNLFNFNLSTYKAGKILDKYAQ